MADDCTRKPTKLVLLDRDGVINADSADYVKTAAEWQPVPGALAAIARLNAAGIQTGLCSNQAGVARGRLSARDLASIHVRFESEMARSNAHLDLWRYCPHSPDDDCGCRKPGSGMLADCMAELRVQPQACVFVGDSLKDMQAALTIGCLPVLVRTGLNPSQTEQATRELGITTVVDDLSAAIELIMAQTTQ